MVVDERIYIYIYMYIQEYNEYIFELGYGLGEGGNNGEGCRIDTGRASGRKVYSSYGKK